MDLTRRRVIRSLSALAGAVAVASTAMPRRGAFQELQRGYDERHHVAPDHSAEIFLRWGDPVFTDAPEFDPHNQSVESQLRQFGYNNDYIAFVPLPVGSSSSTRGLLCVNHESALRHMMFPDPEARDPMAMTRRWVDVEMAAHGQTVVEVYRQQGRWNVNRGSRFNRRISPYSSKVRLSGPAAGHPRLRTPEDPSGRMVLGSIANCGGAISPWGTVLLAEENFQIYFFGRNRDELESRNHAEYAVGAGARYSWFRYYPRYDLRKQPTEPNRYGWLMEVDPYAPASLPVKRTALGRFAHENAAFATTPDGRAVVYSGDDARFQYIYRFVSRDRINYRDRRLNQTLLDHGRLSVARLNDDGSLDWLSLQHGRGALTAKNGFHSQADVLIETRYAASLLGATPMDRPEDLEVSPNKGSIFVNLTHNLLRLPGMTDASNPRGPNLFGHILELMPPKASAGGRDHGAERYEWTTFLLAGNPRNPLHGARYHKQTSDNGWFVSPDNAAFDPQGRLWVATDENRIQGFANGLWFMDIDGPERALSKHFFRAPNGGEVTGPAFTPDGSALFLAVQTPGAELGADFHKPGNLWPDFKPGTPPRPSVLVITRHDGGPIGG